MFDLGDFAAAVFDDGFHFFGQLLDLSGRRILARDKYMLVERQGSLRMATASRARPPWQRIGRWTGEAVGRSRPKESRGFLPRGRSRFFKKARTIRICAPAARGQRVRHFRRILGVRRLAAAIMRGLGSRHGSSAEGDTQLMGRSVRRLSCRHFGCDAGRLRSRGEGARVQRKCGSEMRGGDRSRGFVHGGCRRRIVWSSRLWGRIAKTRRCRRALLSIRPGGCVFSNPRQAASI